MFDKIELTAEQYQQIRQEVLKCYPEEACGFLTHDGFIPCKNVHEQPESNFKISAQDTVLYYSDAIAVVHSHCRSRTKPSIFHPITPSYADTVQQRVSKLPWLIVESEGENVSLPIQYPRVPNPEYLNREFIWFINDCYTLVQDWYRFELGIILEDYVLDKDYKDLRHMNDLFEPHIKNYGFAERPPGQMEEGDVLLLNSAGFHANHLGIFTEGMVLHQNMVSVKVPIEHYIGQINKVLHYVG